MSDPKVTEEFAEQLAEARRVFGQKLKESLREIDQTPVGHVACEIVRARVQGRPFPMGPVVEAILGEDVLRALKDEL